MKLALNDVWKRYPGAAEPVLRGVSLTVEPGEMVCVLGSSGCGKSTLLRICAGLERFDSGTVEVNGTAVREPGLDRILVFQDQDQLFPWLTASGNVAFAQRAAAGSAPGGAVHAALDEVGLAEHGHLFPHQLSGGMRQRVALARSLAVSRGVLLMDEPFGSVDAVTRGRLQELLVAIRRERNATVLFVTHDIGEAILLGDRVVVLSERGTVVADERVGAGDDADALKRTLVTCLGAD